MEINWINGLHKEGKRIFDSVWEAEEWADSIRDDLTGTGFGCVTVGYATPDAKVASYLEQNFPIWAAQRRQSGFDSRLVTVHTATETVDGQTLYKVWTVPVCESYRLNSLRAMTTAYLFNKDSVLLMERSSQKNFLPGVWSGIGGHVEPNEYGDLRSACFREVEEETGLQSKEVQDLVLRYVILRHKKNELRQQFIYFGTTTQIELGTTDEGTLHWIPLGQVFDCNMTDSNRLMLSHYFDSEPSNQVWVGTMYGEVGDPRIHWALMSDWES